MPIAIHYENNIKNYKIWLNIILLLFFFVGFYKNNLNYYFLNQITFKEMIYPLLFLITSLGINFIFNLLTKKNIWQNVDKSIILSLIMPPLFPFFIYFILVIIYNVINLNKKSNYLASIIVFKIITILITTFILHIGYENQMEINNTYLYGIMDLFLGRSIGNFGTTCILLLIVSYLFFNLNFYYKKDIPIYIILTYSILALILGLLNSDLVFIKTILNSHLWFAAIFLAPVNKYSPVSKKTRIFYGLLFGFVAFAFNVFLKMPNGTYISLFLIQTLWLLYCFLGRKKSIFALIY